LLIIVRILRESHMNKFKSLPVILSVFWLSAILYSCGGSDSSSEPDVNIEDAFEDSTADTGEKDLLAQDMQETEEQQQAETVEETAAETGGQKKIGSACSEDNECPAGGSGTPACIKEWPDGYCAVKDCAAHGHDCPGDPGQGTSDSGSKCVKAPTATCLQLCGSGSDCREGYACVQKSDAAGHGQVQVCFPK